MHNPHLKSENCGIWVEYLTILQNSSFVVSDVSLRSDQSNCGVTGVHELTRNFMDCTHSMRWPVTSRSGNKSLWSNELDQSVYTQHHLPADQQKGAESPRPRHCNRDPLGPGTLRHARKRRSRPTGQLGPRRKRKHSDRAAIHLGLKQG